MSFDAEPLSEAEAARLADLDQRYANGELLPDNEAGERAQLAAKSLDFLTADYVAKHPAFRQRLEQIQ